MWHKSSYSAMNGCCVEAAGAFRKAAGSNGNSMCVEAAGCGCTERVTLIRDSKDKTGPVLAFAPAAFGGLLARIKAGELDLV